MKHRDRYLKIVECPTEDQCYIGRCPRVMLGGVHDDDETKVFQELSEVVDEQSLKNYSVNLLLKTIGPEAALEDDRSTVRSDRSGRLPKSPGPRRAK
jgi:hypothetical protein